MAERYLPKSNFLKNFEWETVPLDGHEFGAANLRRMLELMHDEDSSNRDWSTFLISSSDVDSDDISRALLKNANDPHEDTKDEAILGLAKRNHPKALELVISRLGDEWIGDLAIEAAGFLASPDLLPILKEIRQSWNGEDTTLIDAAISSCRNQYRDDQFIWPIGWKE